MADYRLGDDVDDFCTKCKRLTNHLVVSLTDGRPAKVRCRTCYHEQDFRDGIAPPSKKDLKKAELFNEVLSKIAPTAPASGEETAEEEDQSSSKN